MLGSEFQLTRVRGEGRSYNPARARRAHQNQQTDQLRRAQSDVTASQSPSVNDKSVSLEKREPENQDPPKPVVVPVSEPFVSPLSNLERFLESIIPSVPAQYPSKTTMRGWRTCDVEFQPYFFLGDLWESFREWSAYGAGVPLILNDSDSVVQYYVPYLSGIQIYVNSTKSSTKPRQPLEDNDSDFRDSSSDNSSDCELERRPNSLREQRNHYNVASEIPLKMDSLSLRDQQISHQEDFSSDEGESVNSRGHLLFEYLEYDRPHSREPLADKISDLASRFPELKTLRSCDLLPFSWISVAWYYHIITLDCFEAILASVIDGKRTFCRYPIYRIPTGPTLKDLDACFLTYHSLDTPVRGTQSAQTPVVIHPNEIDGVLKMSLPVFGLASYKFKGSMWTPNGESDSQLASSLLQDAANWLRMLQVNHPDFLFFCRR